MERVFISSLARGEMAAIRAATRAAVESLQMRPVMFETAPASRDDSRRALLDELGGCDIVLLLLGAEYGGRTERGVSATEDEFNEALSRGIPVIALVHQVARTRDQDAFVSRVRGTWSEGRLAPGFEGAGDIGFAVVRALDGWRQRGATNEHHAAALERARALAEASRQAGQGDGGAKARVVMVPILGRPIMDAVMLGDGSLGDDLAMCVRASGLVRHNMALQQALAADGVEFETTGSRGYERLRFLVANDGAILAEDEVSSASDFFRSSVIEAARLRRVVEQSCGFALGAWKRIDGRDDIRDVAATIAIPDAEMKVFSDDEFTGNSLSVGHMTSPAVVVAPDPPSVARREDVGSAEFVERLVAEVRHAFVLAGRVR